MTAIAHLSDPHLSVGPLGTVPVTGLQRALGRVLGLDPRPDCVVITGDLANHGAAEEYALLGELLERYPLPVHLTTGNHDDPAAMRDRFAGTDALGGTDRTYYAVDYPGFTLVVLDSNVPGSNSGRIDADQVNWLDEALTARTGTPALVGFHHPPVPVGIPFLDAMNLAGGEELGGVLERHRHVARVLTGHAHRPITATFGGTTMTGAPSTYLQGGLTLREPGGTLVPEPTAFLLHVDTGAGWVTHTVPVSHSTAPTLPW